MFYLRGPGTLIHPVWQTAEAYFVELSLRQEPRADHVAYAFTFWESSTETGAAASSAALSAGTAGQGMTGELRHKVAAGETLWGIAASYGADLDALIRRNPQIKDPDLIHPGEEVRIW